MLYCIITARLSQGKAYPQKLEQHSRVKPLSDEAGYNEVRQGHRLQSYRVYLYQPA